jgi:mono/diheme cytochrome c family protein
VIGLATTSIAWILLAVIAVGWLVYLALNIGSARREVGSEIELAPNRRPYYDDETLEGRRLELVQLLGVLLLIVIVVGLPLYWVLEPSRQAGARDAQVEEFAGWGAGYFETTANGGFNCAGCHGGMNATGGAADYALTDPQTGEVTQVQWKAPALNTVYYRFSEEEVRFIIEYGRPFSPMQAWGTDGGGPMNDQQIDTLLVYLKTIQVEPEDCGEGEEPVAETVTISPNEPIPTICPSGHLPTETQEEIDAAARQSVEDGEYESYGEALFNLEMASGAFSCARCHTQGWSYDQPGVPGQGGLGWNLTGGSENARFPDEQDMIDFVATGSELGVIYGRQSQGSGRMPGFGQMLTDEQISAIVEYVRGL